MAGLAIVVPVLITLLVLNAAAGYVFGALDTLVGVFEGLGISPAASTLIVRAFVVVVLAGIVLGVGFMTRFQFGETAIDALERGIEAIPGVGGVYKSFRQMSEMMVESDTKSFRDVKLVEFPHDNSYTLGFLTTETPQPLQEAADRTDMVTLFLPLAPNPVMGGHLVHVPEDRVMDVDMTVEEGIRTVVTSGVATGGTGDGMAGEPGLSADEMRGIAAESEVDDGTVPGPSDRDSAEDRTDAPVTDGTTTRDADTAEPDPAEREN